MAKKIIETPEQELARLLEGRQAGRYAHTRYTRRIGELTVAIAITEAEQGSDPTAQQTNGGEKSPDATPPIATTDTDPTTEATVSATPAVLPDGMDDCSDPTQAAPSSTNAMGTTPPSSPVSADARLAARGEPSTGLAKLLQRSIDQKLGNGDDAPHLIVEARAGTGKTTTLVEGLKYVQGGTSNLTPSPQQRAVWDAMALSAGKAKSVCFVAFNKSIATELQSRVPKGVDAMTMHSMGFRAVTKALGRQEPSGYALQDLIQDLLGIGPKPQEVLIGGKLAADTYRTQVNAWFSRKNSKAVVIKATEELVSLCKQNLVGWTDGNAGVNGLGTDLRADEELSRLASHYDVELNGSKAEVFSLVPKVLEACKSPKGKISFDDMIWLPVVLNLPLFRYDLLLVDECVPGWTPIMLADGRSATIKEIVESKEEFRVRAYDTKTGRAKNCQVTAKQKILNQKPLVKVKVRHLHRTGTNRKCNFLVCTTDHKVWTINRGWVQAGNLRTGDNVIVETAAKTTQKGKVTAQGRDKLATLQAGNQRGLGNKGGDAETFNRIKGGNGHGPTLAEQTLLDALGFGWEWSFTIKTGDAPQFGRGDKPSHYKIDLAEPNLKIAVEVDGQSHRHRQAQDDKKQQFLEDIGWAVIHVSNRDVIQRTSSVVAQLTALAERIGTANCPRPAKVISVTQVRIPDNYVYDITVEDCHNFYANGILVHNCQDLNRCQQALAKRAGKRLILCGDPRQAIYGFAGADAESMPRMARELSQGECPANQQRGCHTTDSGTCLNCGRVLCQILPLTVTRRCGKAIVDEARKLVPDFEAHESNGPGKVSHAAYPTIPGHKDQRGEWVPTVEIPWEQTYGPMVHAGDMVLCRCNAPLVSQCFRFLKAGKRANIQGRDVGAGLISTVKKLKAQSVEDLVGKVSEWLHREETKEQAKRQPSEAKMIALGDRAACLLCFTEDASTVDEVVGKIERLFTDDKGAAGIRLSSIHKAKGLEARRVFLLQPRGAECPHPMAKSDWQRGQEENLLYVAITRAIEELVYVS